MSILHKLLFNYWYFRKPPWDTNQTPPEVLQFIENNPSGRALDLGCGTGTNAITLAQNGWQVVGVDFVAKAIRAARRKAKQAQTDIDFHVGDVTKLSGIHGPFDFGHRLLPQSFAKGDGSLSLECGALIEYSRNLHALRVFQGGRFNVWKWGG